MNDEVVHLKNLVTALDKENAYLKQLLTQHNITYFNENETEQPTKTDIHSSNEEKPLSPQGKIHLYRSLFRGREDVYALRWENNKTNRNGYSPACENEWRPKFCSKPKIKCNVCPNQKWKPLTDQVVYTLRA